MQHRGWLTGKWAASEARFIDWLQLESALEVGQVVAKEQAERQLPAFTRAS
jgi:hypothetical protein